MLDHNIIKQPEIGISPLDIWKFAIPVLPIPSLHKSARIIPTTPTTPLTPNSNKYSPRSPDINPNINNECTELFEYQYYTYITGKWTKDKIVRCYDNIMVNSIIDNSFEIDYMVINVDNEGWVYSNNYINLYTYGGTTYNKKISQVRRRKWIKII